MGYKVGLEKNYERYNEEDFEIFPEYEKAIPFLTISDEERSKLIIIKKQKEIEDLEKANTKLADQAEEINDLLTRVKAIEREKAEREIPSWRGKL